jgi:hypothetical protein
VRVARAGAHQLVRAHRSLGKPSDREHRASERDRRDHRVHARAVRQSRVDERCGEIDATTERGHEPFDDHEDLLVVGEANAGLLEAPVALDPDSPRAIHHHLAHALVAQQWREGTEAEETVLEEALQLAQLP